MGSSVFQWTGHLASTRFNVVPCSFRLYQAQSSSGLKDTVLILILSPANDSRFGNVPNKFHHWRREMSDYGTLESRVRRKSLLSKVCKPEATIQFFNPGQNL